MTATIDRMWRVALLVLAGCRFNPPPNNANVDGGNDGPQECDPSYSFTFRASHYRLVFADAAKTGWRAAQAACAATRGHLAIIDDRDERDALRVPTENKKPWIGEVQLPTARTPSEMWFRIDGTPTDLALWIANKPDDGDNNENGSEQGGALGANGLDDENVAGQRFYICECDDAVIDATIVDAIK